MSSMFTEKVWRLVAAWCVVASCAALNIVPAAGYDDPLAPIGVYGYPASPKLIILQWGAPTIPEGSTFDGYRLYRKDWKSYVLLGNVVGYQDPSVTSGQAYTYHVCTVVDGDEHCTDDITVGIASTGSGSNDLPTPTITSIKPGQQPNTIVINWTAPTSYDRYQIWETMNGRAQGQVTIDSSGNNGWYPFTLARTFHYTFQVEGCNVSVFGNASCSNWTPFNCVALSSNGAMSDVMVASPQDCMLAHVGNGGILSIVGGQPGVNPFATPTPLAVGAPGAFSAASSTPSQISLSWTSPRNASSLVLTRSPDSEKITLPTSATAYTDAIANPYTEYYYTLCALPSQIGQTQQCVSTAAHALARPIPMSSGAVIGSAGNSEGYAGGHRVLPPTNVRATWAGASVVHVTWTSSGQASASAMLVRYHYGANPYGIYTMTGAQLAADATQFNASVAAPPAGSNAYISVCTVGADDTMGCSIGVVVSRPPLNVQLSVPKL